MLAFLLLVFLGPLAVYCLLLAIINRRPVPVMVRGVWDCVGLLFAASGFFLVAAPALVKILYAKNLGEVPLDALNFEDAVMAIWAEYWLITLLYYLMLVAGIVLLVWWRWNKTVIYNVDADRFGAVLELALAHLGLDATRAGNQLVVGRMTAAPSALENAVRETIRPAAVGSAGEALLIVEPFAALGNVTLHWFTDRAELRDEVEEELERQLSGARLYDNPAGTWFLGIAGALFSLIFVIVLVMLLNVLLPPPRAR